MYRHWGYFSRRRLGVCWRLRVSKVYSSKWRSGTRRVPIIVILVRILGLILLAKVYLIEGPSDQGDLGCARNLLPRGSARDGSTMTTTTALVKGARLAAVSRARVHSVGGRHVSHADVRMHHLYFPVFQLVRSSTPRHVSIYIAHT